jgi:cell division ATPase FtsA
MPEYAKEALGLAARLGHPSGFGGVADDIDKSEFATAIGLMLTDAEQASRAPSNRGGGIKFKTPSAKDVKGKVSKVFGWFKP